MRKKKNFQKCFMACAAILETTKQITYQWINLKRKKENIKKQKKSPPEVLYYTNLI